jgi:hypothetical protein
VTEPRTATVETSCGEREAVGVRASGDRDDADKTDRLPGFGSFEPSRCLVRLLASPVSGAPPMLWSFSSVDDCAAGRTLGFGV